MDFPAECEEYKINLRRSSHSQNPVFKSDPLAYFMLPKVFKNENAPKKPKLRLKNTIIDKTLTYASETWTLTKGDKNKLNIFERKLYRRILGPVYETEKRKWEDINQQRNLCKC
jgi:hypothetical protein